jgi:hypothetical protein
MASILVPMIAAAALSAPQLGDNLATVDVGVVAGSGTGIYAIFVAPDGWVDDCAVLKSDYSARNNDRICTQLLRQKARKAARGPDGKPIHALAVVARNAGDGVSALSLLPADIVMRLPTLPQGGDRPVYLEVMVDERGKVTGCDAVEGADEHLAQAACEQAGRFTLDPRKDRDGAAVPYLAEISVGFVEDDAAS